MKKVVFLDRDGTINFDSGYVRRIQDVILLPQAAKAIGDLKRASFFVVIVTNQSAVGRGMTTAERVEECNAKLKELLIAADSDAVIDHVLFSPTHPDEQSECRKPRTGMLKMLPADFVPDFSQSWMVGDRKSDIEFGINAGIAPDRCLLVRTGAGAENEKEHFQDKEEIFDDLYAATKRILGRD